MCKFLKMIRLLVTTQEKAFRIIWISEKSMTVGWNQV